MIEDKLIHLLKKNAETIDILSNRLDMLTSTKRWHHLWLAILTLAVLFLLIKTI